jgi:hypothetical protein
MTFVPGRAGDGNQPGNTRMRTRRAIATALTIAAIAIAPLLPSAALAKVTRLEITAKQPDGSFQAGDYVRWEGRIHGELSPAAEAIPDLDKPARNTNGMVEYAARIILLMPAGEAGATAHCWSTSPTEATPMPAHCTTARVACRSSPVISIREPAFLRTTDSR